MVLRLHGRGMLSGAKRTDLAGMASTPAILSGIVTRIYSPGGTICRRRPSIIQCPAPVFYARN